MLEIMQDVVLGKSALFGFEAGRCITRISCFSVEKKKIGGKKWKKNTSVFFPIDLFAYLRIFSSSINTSDLFIYTFSYLIHIFFSITHHQSGSTSNTHLDSIGTAIGYYSFFLSSFLHFTFHHTP